MTIATCCCATRAREGHALGNQVAPGHENGVAWRVYGTKGALEWVQKDPNCLWHSPLGEPKRLLTRGGAGSGDAAARVTRIPPGHLEGYLEGFANIYTEAARAMIARREGKAVPDGVTYPGIGDGLAGVAFVMACVHSSKRGDTWVKFGAYTRD